MGNKLDFKNVRIKAITEVGPVAILELDASHGVFNRVTVVAQEVQRLS